VSQRSPSGSAALRPRARLVGLIGEELISDEPVAVVELVKNAYDADATTVSVTFERDGRTLVVADDGIGMSTDVVLDAWFEPGTVSKRRVDHSPGGRPYQGAKGIGRFAAARLARSLLLESSTGDQRVVTVLVDWGRFDEDSYLDEILLEYETRTQPGATRGTTLTLEGLRQTWTESDFRRLHARLARLISPFADVRDFLIKLEVPGFPELSGPVEPPELVLKPRYELIGTLFEDATFEGEVRVDGHLQKLLPRWSIKRRKEPPKCGPFDVVIRAWDRDREGLQPLSQGLSMTLTEIRKTLDEYCGVSVYRNGFRVHPYGERGNDWLGLDIRSRLNPVTRLANNQVVAAVRISREGNPQLKDRSTREGLILNDAYRAFVDWFTEILQLLEEERYRLRPRRRDEAPSESLFEAFDVGPALDEARKVLGAEHPLTRILIESDRTIREGVERAQAAFSRLLMAAGLGQMIDVVLHEIGAPLGKINRQLDVMERELGDTDEATRVMDMVVNIRAWLEQIHGLRQRLEPQTAGRRGRAVSFDVMQEVQDNLDLYDALLGRQRIKTKVIGPESLIVTMSRSAFSQILVNLIDNSIFWLGRQHGHIGGGHIQIEVNASEGGFSVRVSDDGPGVTHQDQAFIFDPYFTRKPNGIGLGLYIARFLIDPYGRLQYGTDCSLGGACFEAIFEKGVGL
jgi:signal transduction histidine kinase